MASKHSTGITATTVRFGDGISAVRALPKAKGQRPGVILLHERYGIDQHTKDLTVKLAQAGFVGLRPIFFTASPAIARPCCAANRESILPTTERWKISTLRSLI